MQAGESYLGCHIHVDILVSRASQPEAASPKKKQWKPPVCEEVLLCPIPEARGPGLRDSEEACYGGKRPGRGVGTGEEYAKNERQNF